MPDFQIEADKLPVHVAFIMDGNGRWARQKGQARTAGHKEGLESAKRIVKAASDIGIRYITLYTFSTENWKRTEDEVAFLMGLISLHLKKEMSFYRKNKIRVVHSGDLDGLPTSVQKEIKTVVNATSMFNGTAVNLAINYGGRNEIIRATNKWVKSGEHGEFSEDALSKYLDCPDFPDPDLIIRTAGEQRLSNFLIWQCAYSELYFSSKLWPDWSRSDLEEAILSYQNRDRKFGGINE